MDVRLPEKVDAIWCSQTLEHQRDVGTFLNKMFDDLTDGGVPAITVSYQANSRLDFGHCNLFSPLILIYHHVCAGFDCIEASVKSYNDNIGIIVRKRWNGIDRTIPKGTLPDTPDKGELIVVEGRKMPMREVLGAEIFPGMARSFPVDVQIPWSGITIL